MPFKPVKASQPCYCPYIRIRIGDRFDDRQDVICQGQDVKLSFRIVSLQFPQHGDTLSQFVFCLCVFRVRESLDVVALYAALTAINPVTDSSVSVHDVKLTFAPLNSLQNLFDVLVYAFGFHRQFYVSA